MSAALNKFSLGNIAVKADLYFRLHLFVMDFRIAKTNSHASCFCELLMLCQLHTTIPSQAFS